MAYQRNYSTKGLEQANVGQIPTNENPKGWMVDSYDVQGGVQTLITITDLIEFHPFKMKKGMSMRVVDYPNAGTITEFVLNTDPTLLVDDNEATIITPDNFANFWDKVTETNTSFSRVYEYAPDTAAGGIPTYPYTSDPAFEDSWTPTYSTALGHKWLRFRDDDELIPSTEIYANWTVPIAISQQPAPGDYVENRFQRFVIDETVYVDKTTFEANVVLNRYYTVLKGSVDVDEGGDVFNIGKGRTFEHLGGTYTFNTAEVQESIPAPPRVAGGVPNNEPVGWTDTPTGDLSSGVLHKIIGTKSPYGELKSEWIIQKVNEDPNYIRYSQAASPNPRDYADRNTSASDGSPADTALESAGWAKTYEEQNFIATRLDDSDPNYLFTDWLVEKIAEESGEYQDRVFKLFDLNLDNNSPELQPPTKRDPTTEGWADAPVPETDTQINYVSEARKYIDGTLKTPWSDPVPYTGQDTFADTITSDAGDNFKYDKELQVEPAAGITLTGKLFKGSVKLWENLDNAITFEWKKVFDNGSVVDLPPDGTTWSLLPAAGGVRDNQAVLIQSTAVTGKAVFRCTQTLTLDVGDPLVFIEEFSIIDVTDGLDTKAMAVSADQQTVIWDTAAFVPVDSTLRAYQSNIPGWPGNSGFKWYVWTGSAWLAISGAEAEYSINGNTLTIDNSVIFVGDATSQEKRYAVSNHATNPDLADFDATFSDYITLVKLASANVGSPGENAISTVLSNEAHTVVLDNTTGNPFAGQIGASGLAITNLQVWDGQTALVYLTDYTIGVVSNTADVTFAFAANGNNVDIYADTWVSSGGAADPTRSAIGAITITITVGGATVTKEFTLASTLDAPGAIILDVDSDSGFSFVPSNRVDKTITANLYDGNELQTSGYEYQFLLNGIEVQAWSTTRTYLLTRGAVDSVAQLTTHVRLVGQTPPLRTQNVQITDVLDATQYRLYYSYTTLPAEPITEPAKPADSTIASFETDYPATGTGWARESQGDTIIWASDGEEQSSGALVFSRAYRIRGEKGDQGPNGDFFFQMYYSGTSVPSSSDPYNQTWDLATMKSKGWVSILPLSGVIWIANRLWQGGPFSSGDPTTPPVSGSVWSAIGKLTATDGTNGADGAPGTAGWSPVFGVVADGTTREVLQLKAWTGGTGTAPGFIGLYIGTSGFVSSKSSAANIKGDAGPAGQDGVVDLQTPSRTTSVVSGNKSISGTIYTVILGSSGVPADGRLAYFEMNLTMQMTGSAFNGQYLYLKHNNINIGRASYGMNQGAGYINITIGGMIKMLPSNNNTITLVPGSTNNNAQMTGMTWYNSAIPL